MGSSPNSSGFPSFHPFYHSLSFTTIRKGLSETFHFWQPLLLLFTRCATSNASRHFKSPLAMGRDAFKPKHASSVSISEVIDTGVNSNYLHPSLQIVICISMLFSLFNEPITFVIVTKKLNNSFVSVTQIDEIGK